ncbi:MAG: BlaI/MecI/CopY family transcriptional regulator [Clostridia bacterium]|nr:BlaI/MecI/CopY family transcriptional regulator [Clostridia bacterium]
MTDYQMGEIETRFAEIIWESEPISSTELARLANESLCWKKSTTYTVLKRLCDKGIFKNEGGSVKSVISREEFYSLQSERFVEDNFKGSLPAFLTAFTKGRQLSQEEIAEIRKMLKQHEEQQ